MSTNTSNSIVDDLKAGIKGLHSAGEAIRGTVNESVDHAFDDKVGEAKNQAITDKGVQGVKATDEHFGTHHGIKSGEHFGTQHGVKSANAGSATGHTQAEPAI